MTLQEVCSLTSALINIPITFLDQESDIVDFCSRHYFHSVQKFLLPSAMNTLLQAMKATDLVCLTDPLHMTIHFLKIHDHTLAVGPYCNDTFNQTEASILFRQLHLAESDVIPFLAYRGQYTLLEEKQVLNCIQRMLRTYTSDLPVYNIRQIGYEERAFLIYQEGSLPSKSYKDIINERYELEHQWKKAIMDGNYNAALRAMNELSKRSSYLLAIGNRMQNEKNALWIRGTIIRLFAVDAGLPPVIIDRITNSATEKNASAKSLEEMSSNNEQMMKELCIEIRKMKHSKYSAMVQSIIYFFNNHYQEDISLNQLAEDLNISYNYMITLFKKETGSTPNAYLTQVRLDQAASLLRTTDKNITEVSTEVGIADANYFTKLFRKAYGVTPVQYKKQS